MLNLQLKYPVSLVRPVPYRATVLVVMCVTSGQENVPMDVTMMEVHPDSGQDLDVRLVRLTYKNYYFGQC